MRGRVAIGLVLLVVASGCVGDLGDELGTCDPFVDVSVFHPASSDRSTVPHGEKGPVPLLVWVDNEAPDPVTVELQVTGGEAQALVHEAGEGDGHEVPEDGRLFEALRFASPADGDELALTVTANADGLASDVRDPLCDDVRSQTVSLQTELEPGAERVEPGEGVLVRTVGWWPNGSSFYTNMERYHDRPDLPHGYLGEYNGSEPLKVYVYNDSRDEMPERYNESGYVTTIEGFNEALKGMQTVGGEVAYLAPEEAYTTEGNEEHPLYGDPLVFYIEALETRTVPCEVPQPVCTSPEPADATG